MGIWDDTYEVRFVLEDGDTLVELFSAVSAEEAEGVATRWAVARGLDFVLISASAVADVRSQRVGLGSRFTRRFSRASERVTSESGVNTRASFDGVPVHRSAPGSRAEVTALEERLRVKLPSDYKRFLEWSAGGQTLDGHVLFPPDAVYILDGPDVSAASALVAIAADDAGDIICLDSDGHVVEARHDPPEAVMVAGTFGEWLATTIAG